jgi:PTS system beta-glucosides-specific IIC component
VLVHIGLNTVDLEKGIFNISVKQGDQVAKGQKIGSFNLEKIKAKGYDPTTMLIFTNGIKEEKLVVLDKAMNDVTKFVAHTTLEGVIENS